MDPLFTDLYQLTMAAAYFRRRVEGTATFSLFIRKLPAGRGFLVAAGLEEALDHLADLCFGGDHLRHLASLGRFDAGFLDYLGRLRFTGSVRAVPEGTVLFPEEPLLEVTAPMIEAQLVESALLNLVHVHTVLASKAARVVLAAGGRPVAEFGLRRSHGEHAAMGAARAGWIAGCDSTSNVLAGRRYGIPLSGTMAHAFVTAFEHELEAFRAYARVFPDTAVLLIDTYDTLEGARKAATVADELARAGHRLAGVRLDSGDLERLSRGVRRILDAAGHPDVRILASGGLDEHDVERLRRGGAPIDGYGIGTRMNVSADAPALDAVYKLVRYDGADVLKLSEGKRTWVGEKAVFRTFDSAGRMTGDVLGLADEPGPPGAATLLEEVMRSGARLGPRPDLGAARARCAAQLAALPAGVRRLDAPETYPVAPSAALLARQEAAITAAAPPPSGRAPPAPHPIRDG